MYDRILIGDAVEQLRSLPSASVDLIFADPPYWLRTDGVLNRVEGTRYSGCEDDWDQFSSPEDYDGFTRAWLSECYRVLKPTGTIWVIGGMQCIYSIGAVMQRLGFWFLNDVVWHKKNPTPNFMGTRLNNSHETLLWASKGRNARFTFNYKTAKELNTDTVTEEEYRRGVRKQLGSVWRISVCQGGERVKDMNGKKLHSAQKPEELLYRAIAISSREGDLVLDPFGGTMTTAVVAKRMGRRYLAIERDATYCEYGEKRLQETVYEPTPVSRAVYDEKPARAKMEDMIAAGVFKAGETFFLKSGEGVATLCADGRLLYGGETLDMHTCAARARGAKAKRLNGFDVWYVRRDGLVPISDLREEYRKSL